MLVWYISEGHSKCNWRLRLKKKKKKEKVKKLVGKKWIFELYDAIFASVTFFSLERNADCIVKLALLPSGIVIGMAHVISDLTDS